MKFTTLLLFFCGLSLLADAQKLRSEDISYSYKRLPSTVLRNTSNYQLTFDPVYEAKNKERISEFVRKEQEAREKYEKEMAAHSGLVKDANTRYEKELAEYNKKSLGTKIVEKSVMDNSKPVRQMIAVPTLQIIEKPVLYSSYDYSVLADTYVKLDGFTKNSSNALKVNVILYGFDYTQPRTLSEEVTSIGRGATSTYKASVYHNEFSYRHPMAVKVVSPEGKELLSVTPPQLNSYKIYKTGNTERPQTVNGDLLIKNLEEKTLQENLAFINNLLNDTFGYSETERKATLYYVKTDDAIYSDLVTAFNEASSGLSILKQDKETAKSKLIKASELWNSALKESDPTNKKARINKDMTIALYYNLLEIYFALGDVPHGESTLEKMNTMNLTNSERKSKLDFDLLFADLKKRQSQIKL
ncbi:hypothetical protein [Daejeonella sp.]|uniref:hypothetical protein n=1 Tax=Daejeonella sp. TaxID=2805397 RepID=UPI0030C5A3C1